MNQGKDECEVCGFRILFRSRAQTADGGSYLSIYLSVCPSVRLSVCPSVRLSVCLSSRCSHLQHRASVKWSFISLQFLNFRQSVGLLGRVISSSQGCCLHTNTKQMQSSMSWVGFEPTILLFERAMTVHALARAVMWSADGGLLGTK
jgi:hypothetical protein